VSVFPSEEVRDLRKAGKTDEAYKRAKELLSESPDDKYLKSEFGWVLWAKSKAAVAGGGDGAARVVNGLLHEYTSLDLKPPDLLFSQLVTQLLKLSPRPRWLLAFLVWAGPDCWRSEDCQPWTPPDGKVIESIVVRAAQAAGKVAHEEGAAEDRAFALGLIEFALKAGNAQDSRWLLYRQALLLGDLGRQDKAYELLVPFVRSKSRDYWAWQALGNTLREADPAEALSLFAKAELLCDKPDFSVGLLEDLARSAAGCEEDDLARWAVKRALEIRASHAWRTPDSLRELAEAPWFASGEACADWKKQLESLASEVDAILYGDLPAVEASFVGCFTPQKSGRRHAKFCVRRAGISEELVAPDNVIAGLGEMSLGDAVTLKLLEDGARQRVLVCERRAEGHPFDQLERLLGIVDHQNYDKHLTSVYVDPDRTILVHYADAPAAEELLPGRAVEVRIARHDERINSYSIAETEMGQSDNIGVQVGPIRLNPKGFGFVGDDIYVPKQLAANLADGTLVRAVAKRERKRDRPGELQWRAVAVEAC
jgi:hypothetical protein